MSEIIQKPCDCDNGFMVWDEPDPSAADGHRQHKETCPDCGGSGVRRFRAIKQSEGDGYPNFPRYEEVKE